jgi:TPR repeat protein
MKNISYYLSLTFFIFWFSWSHSASTEDAYSIIRNGNPEQGYKMLLMLADKNNDSRAFYGLALLFKEGWGVSKDEKIAIEYFKKAANLDHTRAMFDLGTFYQNGLLVKQSYTQAISWYEKAANKGYAAAMYGLGGLYFNGLGVKKDPDKGTMWFTKAAKIGFEPAIKFLDAVNNLGVPSEN